MLNLEGLKYLLIHCPVDKREAVAAKVDEALAIAFPQGLPKDFGKKVQPILPNGLRPKKVYLYSEDGKEKWTEQYSVDCEHFGRFVKRGGCGCGSGNVHKCDHGGQEVDTTRAHCVNCALNKLASPRLLLLHDCQECVEMKNELAELAGPEKVKGLLSGQFRSAIRCVTYMEDQSVDRPTARGALYHVPSVRRELADLKVPEDLVCPLLLDHGEIIGDPMEIARRVSVLIGGAL